MKKILVVLIGGLIIFSCNHNKGDTKTTLETSKIELSSIKYTPSNRQLFDTIAALDKSFWKSYNEGDVNTIIDLMTDDHEF